MKMQTRLQYSAEFKTKIIFELLLTDVSPQKLALKHHISTTSIFRWKKQLIQSASTIFGKPKVTHDEKREIQKLQHKKEMLQHKIKSLNAEKKDQVLHLRINEQPLFPTNDCAHVRKSYLPLTS